MSNLPPGVSESMIPGNQPEEYVEVLRTCSHCKNKEYVTATVSGTYLYWHCEECDTEHEEDEYYDDEPDPDAIRDRLMDR